MIRIGVNPILWSNDDLKSLGAATPLEQCLSEAKAAGYEGIELGHKFPRRAAELGPLLAAHGLALVSGWHSGQLLRRTVAEELEALGPHTELLLALGARVLIFAECTGSVHPHLAAPLTDRPVLDDSGWQRFTEALCAVAAASRRRGLELAYHHHMGTVVQTEEEVDRLMRSTSEEVGLLLDTGHLRLAGGDPLGVAKRWGKRIAHVHCKDVRPAVIAELPIDVSFLDVVRAGGFTVPGDGGIDFEPILRALGAARYDGWLVVEADQDPGRAPPALYAGRGYERLREISTRLSL